VLWLQILIQAQMQMQMQVLIEPKCWLGPYQKQNLKPMKQVLQSLLRDQSRSA
jgi:hypothetical protein